MLTSIAILIFSSLPIYYLINLLFSKLNSSNAIVGIMFLSFVISSIVIWYIDMELPLNQTHIGYKPSTACILGSNCVAS